MSIYTFTAPSLPDCAIEANETIPHTEKVESVQWEYVKSYNHEYVMVVVTNDWYHYAKYAGR